MDAARRDRLVGLALFAIAVVWSVLVYWTIPAGYGEVGARAFPLAFGLILAALSLWMAIWPGEAGGGEDTAEAESAPSLRKGEIASALGVFAAILVYGFLLQRIGFLLATPVVIVALMVLVLRITRPVAVGAMALGITAGCWLVFGKLLGAYLPPGTWITLI